MRLAGMLGERCTHYRPTQGIDADGVAVSTYAVVASDVPCAVQLIGGSRIQQPYGESQLNRYRSYFEADADIEEGDAIIITVGPNVGKVLRSISSWTPMGHHIETMLETMKLWVTPVATFPGTSAIVAVGSAPTVS